jgi:glutamine amidotransferase
VTVTIFDYGAGNLHSLAKAIVAAGGEPTIEPDPSRFAEAQILILPGVGAFGPAAERLAPAREKIRRAIRGGRPCLGICLGMQLLFDRSDEGAGGGLGVVEGVVTRLEASRIPQIGWNHLEEVSDPLVERSSLRHGYYANSFVARAENPGQVGAWSRYEGDRFPATVAVARTLGVQFHPEKSSTPGIALIKAFLEASRS